MRGIFLLGDERLKIKECLARSPDGVNLLMSIPEWSQSDETDEKTATEPKWKEPWVVDIKPITRGTKGNSRELKPSVITKQTGSDLLALTYPDFAASCRQLVQIGNLWFGANGVPRGTLRAIKQEGYGTTSAFFQRISIDYFLTVNMNLLYVDFTSKYRQRNGNWTCTHLWFGMISETTIILARTIGPMVLLAPAHPRYEDFAVTLRQDVPLRIILGSAAAAPIL